MCWGSHLRVMMALVYVGANVEIIIHVSVRWGLLVPRA